MFRRFCFIQKDELDLCLFLQQSCCITLPKFFSLSDYLSIYFYLSLSLSPSFLPSRFLSFSYLYLQVSPSLVIVAITLRSQTAAFHYHSPLCRNAKLCYRFKTNYNECLSTFHVTCKHVLVHICCYQSLYSIIVSFLPFQQR